MGAALGSVGTCVGSLCGGLLAGCCCKLATAGEVDTNKGARCILLWLQVVAVFTGVFMSINPKSWFGPICDKVDFFSTVGVCECRGDASENTCFSDQFIYRSEGSAVVTYILLLILCVSGCSKQAAKDCPGGKFLFMLVLFLVLLFFPNSWMHVYGQIAGVASAVYLIAQTVLLMDFGYAWNEKWHTIAVQKQTGDPSNGILPNPQGHRCWLIMIVVASAALFIFSIVEMILLITGVNHSSSTGAILSIVTFIVGLVLLVISITDWCKHGALLTSCVVLAYIMWLDYEALAMLPEEDGGIVNLLPRWIGLVVCAISLLAFASSVNFSQKKASVPLPTPETDAETGTSAAASAPLQEEEDEVPEGLDQTDFTVQCCVHMTAAVYITAALAPSRSGLTFGFRVAAVTLSLALYGWTLVAPMVLKNRQF